jgi:plasmid maintenance system killer protein
MSNQKKLERMQKRQQQQTAGGDASNAEPDFSSALYGSYGVICSSEKPSRTLLPVKSLTPELDGQSVWLRGRLHTTRAKGKQCFFVLRQAVQTVQCVACVQPEVISKQMVKFIASLSVESIVDVAGVIRLTPRPVESCTQQAVELHVRQLFVVSAAEPRLPLQIEDAARPEPKEGDEEALSIKVNQDTRLGMSSQFVSLYLPDSNTNLGLVHSHRQSILGPAYTGESGHFSHRSGGLRTVSSIVDPS